MASKENAILPCDFAFAVETTVKNDRPSVAEDLSAKFSASTWAKE